MNPGLPNGPIISQGTVPPMMVSVGVARNPGLPNVPGVPIGPRGTMNTGMNLEPVGGPSMTKLMAPMNIGGPHGSPKCLCKICRPELY
jgi:hypothetical protein